MSQVLVGILVDMDGHGMDWHGMHWHPRTEVIREFTNVRRRRQDDGYQYNDINPIVQKN
jgi:hypothetical protein